MSYKHLEIFLDARPPNKSLDGTQKGQKYIIIIIIIIITLQESLVEPSDIVTCILLFSLVPPHNFWASISF